jgi:uncharacterized protein YbaR (Trm112 family)
MTTVDIFTIIHKGVRAAINNCVKKSLVCDISKKRLMVSLEKSIAEMVELITAHAKHEDYYIFNQRRLLESWCGPVIRELEQDHRELHEKEVVIVTMSKTLVKNPSIENLQNLQEQLLDYKTMMWTHLEQEETLVNEAMNEIYTVNEMSKIIQNLEENVEFRDKMLMTKYLFPATTAQEKLQMMGNSNPSKAKSALLGAIIFPVVHTISRYVVATTSPSK